MQSKRFTIKLGLVLSLTSALGLASAEANAMVPQPLVESGPAPAVTLVVGGCGVGFHRGPAGVCRANVGAAVVGARVAVAGVARAGVDRRLSRRTARRTSRRVSRRVVRRHFR